MSKQCIHCGAELPDGASFCPYCESSQEEKTAVRPPRRRKKAAAGGIILAVILVIALAAGLWGWGRSRTQPPEVSQPQPPTESVSQPKNYQGGAEVIYRDGGEQYHIYLSFDSAAAESGLADKLYTTTVAQGSRFGQPLFLFVRWGGSDGRSQAEAQAAFLEKVSQASVTCVARDGAETMMCDLPAADPVVPRAALATTVYYWVECGVNDVVWELTMANGDTISLTTAMDVQPQKELHYYPEDVPMNTAEEVQALLERAGEEAEPDTIVTIHLPAIVYEGGFTMAGRAVNLLGSTDEAGNMTTFTGTVTVDTETPSIPVFQSIRFLGPNRGTGLVTHVGVAAFGCEFLGWDIGYLVENTGWGVAAHCRFEDNAIGYCFDSGESMLTNENFDWNEYVNNGVAVHLVRVPNDLALHFPDSLFSGNGTNVRNDWGGEADLSGATVE